MCLITLLMAVFHLGVPVPGPSYYAGWLTVTLQWNRATVTVISYTCALPAGTAQEVSGDKG